MKYLLLFLLVGCATVESDRLPSESSGKVTLPQWEEYCLRNEWVDPACEVK
jgi:hypothetical protein